MPKTTEYPNRSARLGRFAGAALALCALAFAGDAVIAQPTGETGRIPQFENDQVKVWRSVVQPHSPLPLHRHEHPRVIIALVGGTMKIVEQGGASYGHRDVQRA